MLRGVGNLDQDSQAILRSVIQDLDKEPDDSALKTPEVVSANARLTSAGRVALLKEVLSSPVFSMESEIRSKLEYLLNDIRGNTVDWAGRRLNKFDDSTSTGGTPVPIQRWEYQTLFCKDTTHLDEYGAEGWEMVGICFNSAAAGYVIAFKRPKQ